MKLNIKVIANAKKERIVEEDGITRVYVTAQREKGKANKAVIKALSKYCKVSKTSIKIIKGKLSNNKIIEIK